jgi:hypothetical protein
MGRHPGAGLVDPSPHRLEERIRDRPSTSQILPTAVGMARHELDQGGALRQQDLDLFDGELGIGK